MIYGGTTFREAMDHNKKSILEYLSNTEGKFTSDIVKEYKGEKEKTAIRKALNELRKEGKVTTDDHVHFWQGKFWKLVTNQST